MRFYSLLVFLVCMTLLAGCSGQKSLSENIPIDSSPAPMGAEFAFTLTAIDLAENNALSTQVDEILVLCYLYQSASNASAPILAEYGLYSEETMSKTFDWPTMAENSELIFFLIERDTENEASRIEPAVRLHQSQLLEAFESKDRSTIRKYLGDDDLLGVRRFTFHPRPVHFDISGSHLFDSYHYTVSILPK